MLTENVVDGQAVSLEPARSAEAECARRTARQNARRAIAARLRCADVLRWGSGADCGQSAARAA